MFDNNRKKGSFNIASEASYVYILSRQKFIKKCQKLNTILKELFTDFFPTFFPWLQLIR